MQKQKERDCKKKREKKEKLCIERKEKKCCGVKWKLFDNQKE
jgi:hypothetical protein